MFEGKKVRLRSLELSDLDTVMEYWNASLELREYIGYVLPHSREEEEAWIRSSWEHRKKGTMYNFAIADLATDEFLGACSLGSISQANRSAILGISVHAEKNWGKGYGTDAMKVLLNFGFNYLNLNRIELDVYAYNPRAIHIYEKLGFKRAGRRRQGKFMNGEYHDVIIMDILAAEWQQLVQKEEKS